MRHVLESVFTEVPEDVSPDSPVARWLADGEPQPEGLVVSEFYESLDEDDLRELTSDRMAHTLDFVLDVIHEVLPSAAEEWTPL